MRFEPIKFKDLDEVKKLQPDGWGDIIPEFTFYIEVNYCYPIKATFGNKIVGIGTTIAFENSCWLAHIIVDIEFRKKGIGYEIVRELLRIPVGHSIHSYSLLATELDNPYILKPDSR